MDSTPCEALVSVAASYFYPALIACEDMDSFLRTVRGGMKVCQDACEQ